MGYRSDIRFLIPIENYTKLKNDCLEKYKDGSHFNFLEKEETREDSYKRIFVYFGWDNLKWSDDEEAEQIEAAVLDCDNYHMVRIGENWDDLDENHNLYDTDVDCIQIVRKFEEEKLAA